MFIGSCELFSLSSFFLKFFLVLFFFFGRGGCLGMKRKWIVTWRKFASAYLVRVLFF